MALTPPKRLFNVRTMKTMMYSDAVDVNVKGYAAVSHVWGDQKEYSSEELGIKDGVSWKIPLSYTSKIPRLKKAMLHYKMEYCWFDVLCMPQGEENQEEVNKEIPYMGDYYTGAKMTLVLSTGEDHIFETPFMKLSGLIPSVLKMGPDTIFNRIFTDTYLGSTGLKGEPWFERTWTFQEAVLSKKIMYVGHGKTYLDLSDVLNQRITDFETGHNLSNLPDVTKLAHAIKDYNQHKTNLGRVLNSCVFRDCCRQQDKFYGMLGILGYTTFPVTYDIDIKDLNKKFAQHAYSKGDVSWLATSIDGETGFIQPLYWKIRYIGEIWKEENQGICDIKFRDKTLHINGCIAAVVTDCKPFSNFRDMYYALKKWELDDITITLAMTRYHKLSDTEVKNVPTFIDHLLNLPVNMQLVKSTLNVIFLKHDDRLVLQRRMRENARAHGTSNIFQTTCIKTGKKWPLMVCGTCDIGDKIMLLQVHDNVGRTLGVIVDDSFKRKGLCLYPKLEMPEDSSYVYTSHEFPL